MTPILQAVYGAALIIAAAFYANAMGLSPEAGFALSSGIVGIVWMTLAKPHKRCGKGCA